MEDNRWRNSYSHMAVMTLASFIGYAVENLYVLIRGGYIDNRSSLFPFLFGYGFFVILIGVLIGTPKNLFPLARKRIKISTPLKYLVYFLTMTLLVSLGELALGFTVEWAMGFRYWDYSNIPLHFTPYTSLPTSLGFGFIITLFMGAVYDRLIGVFRRKSGSRAFRRTTVTLFSLVVFDFLLSFAVMFITGSKMTLWKIQVLKK